MNQGFLAPVVQVEFSLNCVKFIINSVAKNMKLKSYEYFGALASPTYFGGSNIFINEPNFP